MMYMDDVNIQLPVTTMEQCDKNWK